MFPHSNIIETNSDIEVHDQLHDEWEINDEDQDEINKEKDIFSDVKELNLRDFSGIKENDNSVLKLKIKEKEILVKKSTLCWFFSNQKQRLSSDRLHRFKDNNIAKQDDKREIKKSKKKTGKKQLKPTKSTNFASDTSESESDKDISLTSETLSETFSDFEEKNVSSDDSLSKNKIMIEIESYYAIYYDNQWYIGRITKQCPDVSGTYEVKFLQRDLDKYKWPQKDDVQTLIRFLSFMVRLT